MADLPGIVGGAPPAADVPDVQDRPTRAGSPRAVSLGVRLAVSVAVSVAVVLGAITLAGMRVASVQLQADLRETARVTAVAVADDIELNPAQLDGDSVVPLLRDFMNAAFDLRAISVFRTDGATPLPVATTSTVDVPPTDLALRVLRTGDEQWTPTNNQVAYVGVPVRSGDSVAGVVAVAVSFASVARIERQAAVAALVGALVAIALLTLVLHLLARRFVLQPLGIIRGAISMARGGDLRARAQVARQDELGEVAGGLNDMLAALDDLHRSLNDRVTAATAALRDRNAQLVRSYDSVMQLRDAVGRAQQLAAVGQTAANIAHQIGTPLNLVSGHVQLLLQEVQEPALRRRLVIVEEQVQRVADTVRTLLMRAGARPDTAPVDIGAMVRRVSEAMRPRVEAAGVSLALDVEDRLPRVTANETQLELAILNLITNAADAMPHGGTLTLRARHTPAGVQVTVSDTGTGIPPELVSTIFDPWVSTKEAGKGTGLGLTITRDVIHALGGTIRVASTPGAGTTFTLDLPPMSESEPTAT